MLDGKPLPRWIPIEEFQPLVGQMFELDCDPKPVAIRLLEAVAGRHRAFDDRPPFALIFHSSPDVLLVDGLYVMKSTGFGPETIFISAIAAAPGAPTGYYYQAVFN